MCRLTMHSGARCRAFRPLRFRRRALRRLRRRQSSRLSKMGGVKARVYVTFKPSVLDPQGQTIRAALNGLGHQGIEDVRQGKYFEITMQPGEDLDAIARDVLSNPVI